MGLIDDPTNLGTRSTTMTCRRRNRILLLLLPCLSFLLFLSTTHAETIGGKSTEYRRTNLGWRGGGGGATQDVRTVPDKKDSRADRSHKGDRRDYGLYDEDGEEVDDLDEAESDAREPSEDVPSSKDTPTPDDPAVVGVKSHHHKKSNAVGDPDGGNDDDDSDESLSEFSDEWEELEDFEDFVEDLVVEPEVRVEVELVEESGAEETDEEVKPSGGGGGVGVRLGRMNSRRRRNSWRSQSSSSKMSHDQQRLLEAWVPHVFFPPTESALMYLKEHARLLDANSKSRLDRRTLYACLLMEWGSVDTKLTSGTRKFVPPTISQTLQAAISMASQPQWRQSAPRTSGIRLYQDDSNMAKSATLSMQETIAMALVREFCIFSGFCMVHVERGLLTNHFCFP